MKSSWAIDSPIKCSTSLLKVLFLVIFGIFELCIFFAVLAHFE